MNLEPLSELAERLQRAESIQDPERKERALEAIASALLQHTRGAGLEQILTAERMAGFKEGLASGKRLTAHTINA